MQKNVVREGRGKEDSASRLCFAGGEEEPFFRGDHRAFGKAMGKENNITAEEKNSSAEEGAAAHL